MNNFKHRFLQDCVKRGLYHQCSNAAGLDAYLSESGGKAYIGFDCTAPSLHIGNLLAIMTLRRFQQLGGEVIIVMGGGTTRIGDPSGKDKTRTILSNEDIASNIASIRTAFDRFLDMDKVTLLNNDDWLKELNYIDFLRDIGSHFSVNRMLTMDSVRLRLEREQALSFIEFNYMIVQAYDFYTLAREYDCRVQMGGSDQWGNIVNGVELARRLGLPELFALTMPLLTTADGKKMGKTAQGAVWLNHNPDQPNYSLSPYHYWQFWRNTPDRDVARLLPIFTDLPFDEVTRLQGLEGKEMNAAKVILATEATALAHGKQAAADAAKGAAEGFQDGGVSENLPTFAVERARLEEGFGLLDAFVVAKLAPSNSEARRLIRGGAAKVNDTPVQNEKMILGTHNIHEGFIKLSIGKKNIALFKIVF